MGTVKPVSVDLTDNGVHEIHHPFISGRSVRTDDPVGMMQMLADVKEQASRLQVIATLLRIAIGNLASAEKTSRVITDKFAIKVVRPNETWDQSVLKNAWKSWPPAQKTYLRIATLAPNLVEIKKLEKSTGDDDFMQWREALLAARKPSNSPPTCTIEDL